MVSDGRYHTELHLATHVLLSFSWYIYRIIFLQFLFCVPILSLWSSWSSDVGLLTSLLMFVSNSFLFSVPISYLLARFIWLYLPVSQLSFHLCSCIFLISKNSSSFFKFYIFIAFCSYFMDALTSLIQGDEEIHEIFRRCFCLPTWFPPCFCFCL